MRKLYSIALLLVLITPFVSCEEDADGAREEKLISTFQIVRFPNDPCVGSNSRNGTCYTSQECSDKSGTSAGSCADGFGVCCTFVISTCGSTTSENLTAWTQASTVASGECGLTVCPIDDTICSLRLDFTNFVITGPSTISLNQVRRMLGHPVQDLTDVTYAITGSSLGTNCLTDTFYATSASPSTGPPQICGTATGEHMYLEADVDKCNYLSFQLAEFAAASGVTATRGISTLATRTWDITVTQIECTSATLPPPGCTKYFWNTNAGRALIRSSNYQVTTTSIHLAQQHDRYCIRRERGMCVGCFAAAATEFAVSGRRGNGAAPETAVNYAQTGGCCGYRVQGGIEDPTIAANNAIEGMAVAGTGNADATEKTTQWGWDCIIIPGAFTTTTATNGAVQTTQSATNLAQILSYSPTAAVRNVGQGPQVCGNNMGIGPGVVDTLLNHADDATNSIILAQGLGSSNLTICTRSTPFMLEFMSDDLEGLGGAALADIGENKVGSLISGANKGFSITHSQLSC